MSLERFINKEFTYAADRTTARLVTGFEDDVVVYHAFELIKWEGVPGAKGTFGKVEDAFIMPDTENGRALVRQRFTEHALARI